MATRYANMNRDQLIRELLNRDQTIESLRSLLTMTRARVKTIRKVAAQASRSS